MVAFDDDQFSLRTQGDVDLIISGALTPWITARIEYTDGHGSHYETTFRGHYQAGSGMYLLASGGNDAT